MEPLCMYQLSLTLEIKALEDAIVAHIENCNSSPMLSKDFLLLAKVAYSQTFQLSMSSSIGSLIRRDIAALLPQLIQTVRPRGFPMKAGISAHSCSALCSRILLVHTARTTSDMSTNAPM